MSVSDVVAGQPISGELSIHDPKDFQVVSVSTWDQKYCLKDADGNPVEGSIPETYDRVAKALAEIEKEPLRNEMYNLFKWAMLNGAIPAGRILSNAGARRYKPATSTINCTVSRTIEDSMVSIADAQKDSMLTLKAGCGIGYDFSTLRPKDAFVAGAGATTSGPLSFMDGFNAYCFTVSSAGGRRGAQMGTMDCQHPDIMDFIRAKRKDGRLRQFNLSVLITDNFIEAVLNDSEWPLVFPLSRKEHGLDSINELEDSNIDVYWRTWPLHDEDYFIQEDGMVACKVYKRIKAKNLWSMIMKSTYDFSDPGFILIDRVNQMNNNWYCEDIRATNPCGEQPLPPYGSCLLGSINLTAFVDRPFSDNASFDFTRFKRVVSIFTRMLDNVVEINGLPLPQQQEEIRTKRRHGMGFTGLGSAMNMLKMRYGSEESVMLAERISKELALEGWRQALELAKEKGPAPILDKEFVVTESMLREKPAMVNDGYKAGDKLKGVQLLVDYSDYMAQIRDELGEEWTEDAIAYGLRFTHHSSIAPTGTISLALANNASNGIEPSFAHHYKRNIIVPGRKTKEQFDVFSAELLAYRKLVDENASAETFEDIQKLPDYFVGADDISPIDHVKVQAVCQKWVDSSISKTINVPTNADYEEFKQIYLNAHELGLKGCTTFRFNPEVHTGVLVREDDLANTEYKFKLKDGREITVKGNRKIKYDGELHNAANLYDALKEGYFGSL